MGFIFDDWHDLIAVGKFDAIDDFWQQISSAQFEPVFLGCLDQLEHHDPRLVARQAALGALGAMSNGCKRAFDRVRRANVTPVLRRKILKRQKRLAVLRQASDGLVVFGIILVGKMIECLFCIFARLSHPDVAQISFRFRLNRLRQFV